MFPLYSALVFTYASCAACQAGSGEISRVWIAHCPQTGFLWHGGRTIMAQAAERTTPARSTSPDVQVDTMDAAVAQQGSLDREKVLPLPGWLVKVYFIFPVILYIPDAIFNYYVYSDGWDTADASPLVQ